MAPSLPQDGGSVSNLVSFIYAQNNIAIILSYRYWSDSFMCI